MAGRKAAGKETKSKKQRRAAAAATAAQSGQSVQAKGKGKGNSKDAGKSALVVPEGMVAAMPDGRPLCFRFSKGTCPATNVPIGKRCMKGWHLCAKGGCHGPHPMTECAA